MSYESYEQPYEEYDPNRQPYYQQQPYEQQQYEQPYGQQYEQQQYEQQYEQPYEQQQYEQPQYEGQYQDQQWAQSGLGWEQHAWDEARLGVPYAQVNELSGTDFPQYQAELPRDLPVPDYPPEYQEYPAHQPSGEYREYAAEPASGFPRQREEQANAAYPDGTDEVDSLDAAARLVSAASEEKPSAKPGSRSTNAANAQGSAGRGAFGAAGIAVVTAIAAVASSGALLVVVALIQLGVALGWQQAVGEHARGRADRRATAITALIGWAATAAAFKLALNNDFLGLPVALGLGFLVLAADQTMRRGRSLGDGERVAGLGISVAGGLFAVLPAGFVVADRADSALTAACASAAALGVLCCALLGRDPVRGIGAGLLLGAVVGAFAAKALQADGGLQAGALGGAVAALAAATAVGAMDRIVAEAEARGSTRIVSQTLPVALAAVGALMASAVFR